MAIRPGIGFRLCRIQTVWIVTNYKVCIERERKARIVDEEHNPVLSSCIDYVWRKFRRYGGIELSERTHRKGSGWYTAFQRGDDAISTEDMRNDATI